MSKNIISIDWFAGQDLIPQDFFFEALEIITKHGYASAGVPLAQYARDIQENNLDGQGYVLYLRNKHLMAQLGLIHLWRASQQHLFVPDLAKAARAFV